MHGSLLTNMIGFVIKIISLIMQAAIKIHFVCVHWGEGGGGGKLILTLGCPPGHCSLWLISTTVMVLVTCKFDEDPIKNEVAILRTTFSPLCQWELLVAMETRVLIGSTPKCLLSLFPTPMMLHITFNQDWPTCLRDIQSKEISNDQELIQSDPTSCPQNQKGNNLKVWKDHLYTTISLSYEFMTQVS